MVDCSCYHDEINFLGKRGVCWGTKERESCSCGGDAAKCDFYPIVREEEKKPVTNADRIRSMTDEELANFLGFVAQDAFCYGRGIRDKMVLFPFGEYDSTIEWLRREAKNEESI